MNLNKLFNDLRLYVCVCTYGLLYNNVMHLVQTFISKFYAFSTIQVKNNFDECNKDEKYQLVKRGCIEKMNEAYNPDNQPAGCGFGIGAVATYEVWVWRMKTMERIDVERSPRTRDRE